LWSPGLRLGLRTASAGLRGPKAGDEGRGTSNNLTQRSRKFESLLVNLENCLLELF
jgi:hypothetical protein